MRKILVTGACGQIGSELAIELRKKYGGDNVIAAGHKTEPGETLFNSGPFEFIDITNREKVEAVILPTERKWKPLSGSMASTQSTTWLPYSPPWARRIPSCAGT